MGSGRSCCIEIENECDYTFGNPRMYLYSGVCATPFPPTLSPGASGSALFRKKPVLARGSIGVVTYDLLNNDTNLTAEEIAVMFHVPFDFNLYHNCYAVGVFDQSTECDYDLYYQMYEKTPTTFSRQRADGSCLTYVGVNITIMGTMSDTDEPVIKVQVNQNEKKK